MPWNTTQLGPNTPNVNIQVNSQMQCSQVFHTSTKRWQQVCARKQQNTNCTYRLSLFSNEWHTVLHFDALTHNLHLCAYSGLPNTLKIHWEKVFKVFQAVATVKLIHAKKITNLTRLSRLEMKTAIAWHYRTTDVVGIWIKAGPQPLFPSKPAGWADPNSISRFGLITTPYFTWT